MQVRFLAIATLAPLLALSCTTTTPVASNTSGQATTTVQAPSFSAPVIANLQPGSKAIIGDELFELNFDVKKAGGGVINKYGLSSSQGSGLIAPQQPIPVIDNGHVKLTAAGPLPNITRTGDYDCEFWVVDNNNQESNHLTFKMKIQ